MYLKKLKIQNYRKFYCKENTSHKFVFTNQNASTMEECKKETVGIEKTDETKKKRFSTLTRTTLIAGQNNTGKSTVATIFKKLVRKQTFTAKDFNFNYINEANHKIKEILSKDESVGENDLPYIILEFVIGVDDGRMDYIHKLEQFINIFEADTLKEVLIKIKLELKDTQDILDKIEGFRNDTENLDLHKIIEEQTLKATYFDEKYNRIKNVKIDEIISFKYIRANNVTDKNILSSSFNKILEFEFNNAEKVDEEVRNVNESLNRNIITCHNEELNQKLSSGIPKDKVQINLTSNITKERLIKDIIQYRYQEDDLILDEDKFGMGYTRLILILAEILEYYIKYDTTTVESKVNLIFIEEPETFMHPQMQENFMGNLEKLVSEFIKTSKSDDSNINTQLIVSTHSPHILNSKIEKSKTLNNLNYIHLVDMNNVVVKNLKDSDLLKTDTGKNSKLLFQIKYMKYNLPELFFSDAIFFVEGPTERTYLNYCLEHFGNLRNYYVSIFIVGGDYAHLYHNLIKTLGIPTAIITDLDIKRDDDTTNPKENIEPSDISTNRSLRFIADNNNLENIINCIDGQNDCANIRFFTQHKPINNYYATSFEEALILHNYDQEFLHKALSNTMPRKFDVSKIPACEKYLIEHSYEAQKSLGANNLKTKFSYHLFEVLEENEVDIKKQIPEYLYDAITFIKEKLNAGRS